VLLQVHDLAAGYGKLKVLSDVSLSITPGEFVAVLGPNGAGKTTLLNTLFGLVTPMAGRIEYADEDITGLGSHQVIRRGIGLVPQGRLIFSPLTVERNLELGGLAAGIPFGHPVSRRQLELVFSLFPRLEERRQQRAGTLSGGEQQMLAVGRALMSDPKLLLLDEPSLGLAPMLIQNIFDGIAELGEMGMTILLVEQNVNLALEYVKRVYLLNVGRVVLEETSERLRQHPELGALYLGQHHGKAQSASNSSA
jgi:branched-chain amino acid transport system ATP-binding protein